MDDSQVKKPIIRVGSLQNNFVSNVVQPFYAWQSSVACQLK